MTPSTQSEATKPEAIQSGSVADQPLSASQRWAYGLGVGLAVYLLVAAVDALSLAFQGVLGPQAEALMTLATNPFLGLVLGILVTALVQSSSAVTSLMVAMVAGGLPVEIAIPAILGSNVGTTVTNTLVSLGYVGDDEGFERGFAAATVHDFFNLLGLLIVFPLEVTLHPLAKAAAWLADQIPLGTESGVHLPSLAVALTPARWLLRLVANGLPAPWDTFACLGGSLAVLMVAVSGLSWLLRQLFSRVAQEGIESALDRGPLWSLAAGTGITALVQSSSITTSLTVPLASAGMVSLETIYPFVVGANIGTCATVLLAAAAITGPLQTLVFRVAFVHIGFNLLIALLVYGLPWLRSGPLRAARWLARLATEYRLLAIGYVRSLFFVIPSLFLLISLWVFPSTAMI
ncbi:MAG: Na/Pi symporter [Cyanobacteria bacterium J06648_16]